MKAAGIVLLSIALIGSLSGCATETEPSQRRTNYQARENARNQQAARERWLNVGPCHGSCGTPAGMTDPTRNAR
jgi:hypothetical protein